MKRIYKLASILLATSISLAAQPGALKLSDKQSVLTVTPYTAFTAAANSLLNGTVKGNYEVAYGDGFGGAVQHTQIGITPSGADLNRYIYHDALARPTYSSLPYPSTAKGAFGWNNNDCYAFYQDDSPGETVEYEPSGLERPVKNSHPGKAWADADRADKTYYTCNKNSDADLVCALFTVKNDALTKSATPYADGALTVVRHTNEDGHIRYIFTDNQGRILLERTKNGTEPLDTYYVYNDYGMLCYVLPPLASDATQSPASYPDTEPALLQYGYIYKYDGLDRCTEKKLPGCDPIYMRYDYMNRLIFTQDGVQRSKPTPEWSFFIYDYFGRLALNGICTNSTESVHAISQQEVYAAYTGSTSTLNSCGYEIYRLTLSNPEIHAVNYYDGYSFLSLPGFSGDSNFSGTVNDAKGLQTGTITARLGENSKSYSATYYDLYDRPVKNISTNHLGGHEMTSTTYTFTGKTEHIAHTHTATGKPSQTETYTYAYDNAERLTKTTYTLNNNPAVTLAENSYDELGRILTKKLHGNAYSYSYAYNLRSWLTGINGTAFTQSLYYNSGPGTACYNGNISSMTWKGGTESTVRGYKFSYDPLNRMAGSVYGEGITLDSNPNHYNETLSYDKMGNMTTLQRQGKLSDGTFAPVDNLTLTYNGNQLKKVTDAATSSAFSGSMHFSDGSNLVTEYTYDNNGNLTQDLNKNISGITYNSLNLPQTIIFSNGSSISYLYGTDGTMLQAKHTLESTVNTTDYCGTIVYQNGTLASVLTEEGYVTLNGTTPTFHYDLKDHQGNNRVVINQNGTVEQVNHYYPFGALMAESSGQDLQPWKYGDKELDRTNGLDWYDFSARRMDPVLPGFKSVDPMAEKYYSLSPYTYCLNNPIRFVDPGGMTPNDGVKNKSIWEKVVQRINNLFSIDINVSSQSTLSDCARTMVTNFQTIQHATDVINMYVEGVSTLNPLASTITTAVKSLNEQKVTSKDKIFTVMEIVPLVSPVFKVSKAADAILNASDILRIENAATRINKSINVVGSRASGTAGAFSDWDYVIEGINSKSWNKIKNSLPGAKSIINNTSRNIDLIKTPLDKNKPYITINPKKIISNENR